MKKVVVVKNAGTVLNIAKGAAVAFGAAGIALGIVKIVRSSKDPEEGLTDEEIDEIALAEYKAKRERAKKYRKARGITLGIIGITSGATLLSLGAIGFSPAARKLEDSVRDSKLVKSVRVTGNTIRAIKDGSGAEHLKLIAGNAYNSAADYIKNTAIPSVNDYIKETAIPAIRTKAEDTVISKVKMIPVFTGSSEDQVL